MKEHHTFDKDLNSGTGPVFSKSKDEMWEEFVHKAGINENTRRLSVTRSFVAVAAGLAVLAVLSVAARFYRVEISCPCGTSKTVTLPCDSEVQLNAQSTLSYHPLWWAINRKCSLNGEAFFKVQPGRKFSVESGGNTTTVLGTSFNIYARNNDYKVYCATGKVLVSNAANDEKVLTPGMFLNKSKSGFEVLPDVKKEQIIGWKNRMLLYMAEPIVNVLKEMERQYNVEIEYDRSFSAYTINGAIPLDMSVDSCLNVVCSPFNVQVQKIADKKYKLVRD